MALVGKNLPDSAGDLKEVGLIPGLARYPRREHGEKVKSLSRVRLLVTPWTAAYQAPPSMGFSRQEYWSGVPLPSLVRKTESLQM